MHYCISMLCKIYIKKCNGEDQIMLLLKHLLQKDE